MKLILDTETTGLFKNGSKYTELINFDNCRMVQLCMILTDDDYNIMEEYDIIIKCDFVISNSHIHGITNEISLKGISIENMSDILDDVLNRTDRIYIHNSSFDTTVIFSELYRINRLDVINKFMNISIICSMKSTINYVGVYGKNKNYGFKYPKLCELFLKLFDKPLEHAHNCIYDVKNLLCCLKKLTEIGFII